MVPILRVPCPKAASGSASMEVRARERSFFIK
jgi:hypothetical protein